MTGSWLNTDKPMSGSELLRQGLGRGRKDTCDILPNYDEIFALEAKLKEEKENESGNNNNNNNDNNNNDNDNKKDNVQKNNNNNNKSNLKETQGMRVYSPHQSTNEDSGGFFYFYSCDVGMLLLWSLLCFFFVFVCTYRGWCQLGLQMSENQTIFFEKKVRCGGCGWYAL